MSADESTWKRRRRQNGQLNSLHYLALYVLLLLVNIASTNASIFNLGRKKFSFEGLINAGSVGLDNLDGQVAAFGDFNGDSAMDLFVISNDAKRVTVYLWDHDSFSFQLSPSSEITIPEGRKIVNIIPADFSYDGKLDLLVMMKASGSSNTEMMLWLSSSEGSFGKCEL
jgi:integrin alpha FG-GAP repeat containing protein 1